jgi:hypothetical protein
MTVEMVVPDDVIVCAVVNLLEYSCDRVGLALTDASAAAQRSGPLAAGIEVLLTISTLPAILDHPAEWAAFASSFTQPGKSFSIEFKNKPPVDRPPSFFNRGTGAETTVAADSAQKTLANPIRDAGIRNETKSDKAALKSLLISLSFTFMPPDKNEYISVKQNGHAVNCRDIRSPRLDAIFYIQSRFVVTI